MGDFNIKTKNNKMEKKRKDFWIMFVIIWSIILLLIVQTVVEGPEGDKFLIPIQAPMELNK